MSLASTAPGLLSRTEGYRRCADLFGEAGTVDAYLRFELALAEAQAELGVIPGEALPAIRRACTPGTLDLHALREGAAQVGYPIVTLVSMLAEAAGEAGQWLHYGATTQDVMDTAQVLQSRAALAAIQADLSVLCSALADLADRHRTTPMAGRSKLQHGVPLSFGYKAAVWLDQIDRCAARLGRTVQEASVLQFGGAVGTLASLGAKGADVRRALAARLDLEDPVISWHVSRDRMAALTGDAAITLAALAKMASDIAHMSSTEVGELSEPAAAGRGSSSTMPQKRNPVICEAIIEASRQTGGAPAAVLDAMLQSHERGIGHGYAERMAVCGSIQNLAGAVTLAQELIEGLVVNETRMSENLRLTGGLIHSEALMMRLSSAVGRLHAHKVLHEVVPLVSEQGLPLETALKHLLGDAAPADLPTAEQQAAAPQAMIDAVLKRVRAKMC